MNYKRIITKQKNEVKILIINKGVIIKQKNEVKTLIINMGVIIKQKNEGKIVIKTIRVLPGRKKLRLQKRFQNGKKNFLFHSLLTHTKCIGGFVGTHQELMNGNRIDVCTDNGVM
jgi:hypothetical protein